MGMERLVPTLDDLALMLSLLPRSATGQKLSVYTQLLHSPRREGEVDGALQRHLIIVDNGRSTMRDSQLREALYCIRCGACLNACPVFREIGGHAYVGSDGEIAPYSGPIGSVVSPGLLGLPKFGQLAQASSLCGACKDACPVEIDLPSLLTKVRVGAPKMESGHQGIGLSPATRFALQAFTAVAASPRLFGLMQKLGALAAGAISPASDWMRMPAFTGWGLSKDLLRPARRSFRERWNGGAAKAVHDTAASTPEAGDGGNMEPLPDDGNHQVAPAMATVDQFSAELQALGADVRRVQPLGLEKALVQLLKERAVDRVLAWETIDGLDAAALDTSGNTKLGETHSGAADRDNRLPVCDRGYGHACSEQFEGTAAERIASARGAHCRGEQVANRWVS